MQEWILVETATANFDDKRLDRRYRIVLDALSQKPSLKFPAACNARAEVAGAYRLLVNEKVEDRKLLAPHRDATT